MTNDVRSDLPMPDSSMLRNRVLLQNNCSLLTVDIGDHSYGGVFLKCAEHEIAPRLFKVGRYCSFGDHVTVSVGISGRHHIENLTTFPLPMRVDPSLLAEIDAMYPPKSELSLSHRSAEKDLNVTIGNDVWIGNHVTINAGVIIGDGAIVGSHALVTKNIDPYSIVGGNPVREIRKRFSSQAIEMLLATRWWELEPGEVYRRLEGSFYSADIEHVASLLQQQHAIA